MDGLTDKYIGKLLENTKKKYGLLEKMLDLTKAQSETVKEDGIEALERLIQEKQVLIEEIDKLDGEFKIYFQRLKHELKVNSLEEVKNPGDIAGVAELKKYVGRVMAILGEIFEIETRNNARAKGLLDGFAQEMRKINQNKRVSSVYAQSKEMQPPSYFIDKKK